MVIQFPYSESEREFSLDWAEWSGGGADMEKRESGEGNRLSLYTDIKGLDVKLPTSIVFAHPKHPPRKTHTLFDLLYVRFWGQVE